MNDHYKLFLDKQTLFECKVELEGADIRNARARVVVENTNHSVLFEGQIDSTGKCTIPIKKLRGLFNEGDSGDIKLEIIAEDLYFQPWSNKFKTEMSKKMTVEVVENQSHSTPKLKVEVNSNSDQDRVVNEIISSLHRKNISKDNISNKMHIVKKEIKNNLISLDESFDMSKIIAQVVKNL
jgi:hypothetical protein